MCVAVHVPVAPVFVHVPFAASGDMNVPDMRAPVVAVTVAAPLDATDPETANNGPYTPTEVRNRHEPEIWPLMSINRLLQSPMLVPANETFQYPANLRTAEPTDACPLKL